MNRLMLAVSFLAMSTSSKNLTPVLDFFSREFTPKAGFETYTGEEAACVLDKAVHTGAFASACNCAASCLIMPAQRI
jgi:hypothetical protein